MEKEEIMKKWKSIPGSVKYIRMQNGGVLFSDYYDFRDFDQWIWLYYSGKLIGKININAIEEIF